jgi:hypothetical protein
MSSARAAERKSARDGRKLLEDALEELGDHPAAASIRIAERSLKQLDRESTDSLDFRHLRHAIEHLSDAIAVLQDAGTPAAHQATETLARTLALLYPLTKALRRRRRRVE